MPEISFGKRLGRGTGAVRIRCLVGVGSLLGRTCGERIFRDGDGLRTLGRACGERIFREGDGLRTLGRALDDRRRFASSSPRVKDGKAAIATATIPRTIVRRTTFFDTRRMEMIMIFSLFLYNKTAVLLRLAGCPALPYGETD